MRTSTRTHRAAVLVSGALAALLVGGATAPAAYAQPGDKPSAHGKKVGHTKKKGSSSTKGRSGERSTDKSGGQSRGTKGDNRASSNMDGAGHNDQWQAQADPDGDENGGIDQPGGDGGYDPKGWDGNNGSGNDPDCEDDNRGKGVPGHCKDRPAKPEQAQTPEKPREPQSPGTPQQGEGQKPDDKEESTDETPAAAPTPPAGGRIVTETVTEVLGVERFAGAMAGRAPAAAATPAAATPAADATGDVAATGTADGMLPDTGADAAMLAMLAGGLAAAGAGTVLVRRGRASQG